MVYSSSRLGRLALASLFSCVVGVGAASAQIAVNIGGAVVTFEQIDCKLKFAVLQQPTESNYGTIESSCSGSGMVETLRAQQRVRGTALAISSRSGRSCRQIVVGDETYRSCSSSRPLKFYMNFERRGSGPVALSAERAPRVVDRAEFLSTLRASLFPRKLKLPIAPASFLTGGLGTVSGRGQLRRPLVSGLVNITVQVANEVR